MAKAEEGRNWPASICALPHLSSLDISVVEYIADAVEVMRAGQIVEQGPSARVLRAPQHEYTRPLLSAVPRLQSAV